MFNRLTLASLFTIAVSTSAAAQPWLDAYKTGDYRTAAAILHPLVLDVEEPQLDAVATEYLARMYAQGLGVATDAILACSLFDMAARAAENGRAILRDLDDLRVELARRASFAQNREEQCGRLGKEERMEAGRLLGCFTAAFPDHHFDLAPGYSVDVTRSGLRVHQGHEEGFEQLGINGCVAGVALVRYTRTEPPAGLAGASARHFIEVFAWSRQNRAGTTPIRNLRWTVREVIGTRLTFRTQQTLLDDGTSGWPLPPLPIALSDVALQMAPSGEVSWRFQSAGEHDGVIERILPRRAAVSKAPLQGTGSVRIRVVDQSGAPRAGATVRLAGLATREAKTTQDGTVVFDALPTGRFDVLAVGDAQETMWPSRYVDVAEAAVAPFDVTLRRAGQQMMILACGTTTAALSTLAAFARDADAVLRVRVEGQRAFDSPPSEEFTSIWTSNDLGILQVFKTTPGTRGSGVITVLQTGGSIDRGDAIDRLSYNHLAPLSVGDEYLLFLKQDEGSGGMGIHMGEEGAFRFRNGLVEPLGTGALAAEWTNAPIAEFLKELSGVTSGR